jgi:hypothetical protein
LATSIVASSVTRNPFSNFAWSPSFCESAVISAPLVDRLAAQLDDDDAAVKAPDVGQGLDQDLRSFCRVDRHQWLTLLFAA